MSAPAGQRLIAALPMYDWPERRDQVDAGWNRIRDHLRGCGLAAPDRLVRRNADMPAVAGGIRDAAGRIIAPDPATLDPEGLDLATLWRHPDLLFGQTCWGPMEEGLADHVAVIGQPDYSDIEGGQGGYYSSAVIIRADHPAAPADHCPAPADGRALLPLDRLAGLTFAYNEHASRSGFKAIAADLAGLSSGMTIFSRLVETGGHRLSIRALARGEADCATIDCLSWALALAHEPAAAAVRVAGWTARRKGLPFIQSLATRGLTGAVRAWDEAPLGLAGRDT